MNEYIKQGNDFLAENKIIFEAKKSAIQSPPLWTKEGEDYGVKYDIQLTKKTDWPDKPIKNFFFNFWGSIANKKAGKIKLEAYDALSCLTKQDPGTLWDFIAEYGYEANEETEKTYNAVKEEWQKVKNFFTEEEISKLEEIQ